MTRRLRRLLVWCCVYARAWEQLHDHRTWPSADSPEAQAAARSIRTPPVEIARMCAERADACVAGFDAGLGGTT